MQNDRVIYKQHIPPQKEYTEIEAATNAFKVVFVDEQNGYPTVWFETVTKTSFEVKSSV